MRTVNEIIFNKDTERTVYTSAIINKTFNAVIKDEEFDDLREIVDDLSSSYGNRHGLIKGLGARGVREVLGCIGIYLTQFDDETINSAIEKRSGRKTFVPRWGNTPLC